jgi:hypothetical protein
MNFAAYPKWENDLQRPRQGKRSIQFYQSTWQKVLRKRCTIVVFLRTFIVLAGECSICPTATVTQCKDT